MEEEEAEGEVEEKRKQRGRKKTAEIAGCSAMWGTIFSKKRWHFLMVF